MALITLRQLLDHAGEHNYAVPSFNVNNLEQIQAIMQAADATNSPVIMQASSGARDAARRRLRPEACRGSRRGRTKMADREARHIPA